MGEVLQGGGGGGGVASPKRKLGGEAGSSSSIVLPVKISIAQHKIVLGKYSSSFHQDRGWRNNMLNTLFEHPWCVFKKPISCWVFHVTRQRGFPLTRRRF